jgi:DNA-directed RNA polymerase alpha subunit
MKNQELKKNFLLQLSVPARRALENKGINTLEALAALSQKELMELHGMGKSSLPKLEAALKEKGYSFKK